MKKNEKKVFVEPFFKAEKVEVEGFCVTSQKPAKARVSELKVEGYETKEMEITFD